MILLCLSIYLYSSDFEVGRVVVVEVELVVNERGCEKSVVCNGVVKWW